MGEGEKGGARRGEMCSQKRIELFGEGVLLFR